MHSRLTDLPLKKPGSRTSSDGTVERSVSVEQRIACLVSLKVKCLDIYIPPLTGKPWPAVFTIQSGVLTSNNIRWHSASSSILLPKMNGLWTSQYAAITDPPMPQWAALWPSPRNVLWQRLTIFSSEYYQILIGYRILIAAHLPTLEGWKVELAWARWV